MQATADRTSSLLADALTRHDAPAAAALYAEDGRIVVTGELIAGREQIEAYWRAGITLGLARAALTPTELRVGERYAVEAGRYELALSPETGRAAAVDRGSYLALHRRDDGGAWWRVVDLFDSDPATVPGPEPQEGK